MDVVEIWVDKDVVRTDRTISFFSNEVDSQVSGNTDIAKIIEQNPHLLQLRNTLITFTVLHFDLGMYHSSFLMNQYLNKA